MPRNNYRAPQQPVRNPENKIMHLQATHDALVKTSSIISLHRRDPKEAKEAEQCVTRLLEIMLATSEDIYNQISGELSQKAKVPEEFDRMVQALEDLLK